MNGLHPKLEQIFAYTARRLGCTVTELQTNQSTVLPAQAPAHENFLQTTALNKRDVICVTQIAESSVIRTHPQPGGAVRLALQLVENKIFNAEDNLLYEQMCLFLRRVRSRCG